MKKLKYILPAFIVGLLLGGLLCYGGMELIPRVQENRNVYDRFTVGEPVTIEGVTPLLPHNTIARAAFVACSTAKEVENADIDRIRSFLDQYQVAIFYIANEDFRALIPPEELFNEQATGLAAWKAPIYTGVFNEKALSPATYLLISPDGTLLFKSHDLNKVSDYLAKQ